MPNKCWLTTLREIPIILEISRWVLPYLKYKKAALDLAEVDIFIYIIFYYTIYKLVYIFPQKHKRLLSLRQPVRTIKI